MQIAACAAGEATSWNRLLLVPADWRLRSVKLRSLNALAFADARWPR